MQRLGHLEEGLLREVLCPQAVHKLSGLVPLRIKLLIKVRQPSLYEHQEPLSIINNSRVRCYDQSDRCYVIFYSHQCI